MNKSDLLDLDTWEALTIRLDEEWDQLSHEDIESILSAREKLMKQAMDHIKRSPATVNQAQVRSPYAQRVADILERDQRIIERMQQQKREASQQIRRLRKTSEQKQGYEISEAGVVTDSMFFDKKR